METVPVRIARTDEERAAIYRFRYEVYAEELGRRLGGMDRQRRWLHDEEDDHPNTTLVYTHDGDAVTGTARLLRWDPGEVPETVVEDLSLDHFPTISQLTCAEYGRLMVRPDLRGQSLFASLVQFAYDTCASSGVDLVFCTASTGLVRHYRALGMRPYRGRLIQRPGDIQVPLVCLLSDRAWLASVGSFLADRVDLHFGPGKRPPLDLAQFEGVFEEEVLPIRLDPEWVWQRVERALAHPAGQPLHFLDALDEPTLRRLSELGFVLEVPADRVVLEKGLAQQEMYVILAGTFEAYDGSRRLALMGPGEVFGEMAFFGTSGRRNASVRAVTDAEVLVVRRHAVDDLRSTDPELAVDLLFLLARALADRFAA